MPDKVTLSLKYDFSLMTYFGCSGFLRVAKHDMAVFPGDRLRDWESYCHAALVYQDNGGDFEHFY